MDRILIDMLVTGLPLVPVFLGIYTVFRIRADFDLTVEGSFVTGGAACAVAITHGVQPWLAVVLGVVAGVLAGLCTAGLHLLLGVPVLLAGLIMSIGLFSVNLAILGQPTVSLGMNKTVFSGLTGLGSPGADLAQAALMAAVVLVVLVAFGYYMKSEAGLAMRASGVNARMARSLGIDDKVITVTGLALANGLAGLGASLAVQYQGYADVNMGVGTFVAGVGAIMLGELFLRPTGSTTVRMLLAVLLGTLLYRLVLVSALRYGLPAGDLKAVTALTLIIAIAAERYLRIFSRMARARGLDRRRTAIVAEGR
ncbi:ABC transporter permease [Gryllotalpicola koreensis]|uniref:ABC transporter permease n=1 Tax=Gryllotalpicola koreensis TaxID=993086 RepID=A0ABP8ACR3_9MICO